MKILLVFPQIEHGVTTVEDKKGWASILLGYPAITLPHLAALTPRKHDVEIINENYDDLDFDADVDLVGITCFTMTAPRVYEIADEFRKRGKAVVLGGFHPSALPEEAIQHADSVVIGEGDYSWQQAVKDFENGELKKFYRAEKSVDMASLPPIRRDLIKHMPLAGGVQSTRGCFHQCEFCAITSFYGHEMKQRPVENVVDEIEQMPNKIFLLHDPHLTVNPKYARALFKELIKRKINKGWIANGTSNVLANIDDEFLELARKSGCVEWFVGFESVNQEALNHIHKSHNTVKNFKKMIKRLHDYGMTVQGGIIFGFDEDTLDTFEATLEQINYMDMDVLEINILTPYPGTPLFHRLEKEGRILTKDWSKYNQIDVVFEPKNMSPQELKEGAGYVAKEFYSIPNVIIRDLKILTTVRSPTFILPAGTNISFRKYYKKDLPM
jgi:radical SAM superfamily enzyme YgiQ (UPF0313 family)